MSRTLNRQVWLSPLDKCDYCQKPFGDGEGESRVMADAPTHLGGPWGNLCDTCIQNFGIAEFGVGKGQLYELLEIGRDEDNNPLKFWVKTDG